MSSFEKAWRIAKGLSPGERADAERFADKRDMARPLDPQGMEMPRIGDRMDRMGENWFHNCPFCGAEGSMEHEYIGTYTNGGDSYVCQECHRSIDLSDDGQIIGFRDNDDMRGHKEGDQKIRDMFATRPTKKGE